MSQQISMVKSFQSPMCFFLSEARTVTIQIPNTQILENIRIIDSCKNLITKNDTKDGETGTQTEKYKIQKSNLVKKTVR